MPIVTSIKELDGAADVVVVGSGFGALFFLHRFLEKTPNSRVLVLEAGGFFSLDEQRDRGSNSEYPPTSYAHFPEGHKRWNFTIGLGGGTLCWWGQAPRMHPSDFHLRTLYNVGNDWPLSYADLEPFYCEAEDIIGVAGDSDIVGPYWRSRPYPMPAFLASDADARMREIYPNLQLALPAARASVPNGPRPQCCAFGDCKLCPNDAKFTANNGLHHIINDPRVTVLLRANVHALETSAGKVTAAVFSLGSAIHKAGGNLFILGANAIFNTSILKRSSINHRLLGKGINEQNGCMVEAQFAGISGINGGTSATGMFIGFLDGDHRKQAGAVTAFFDNRWSAYGLRTEYDKLLFTLPIVLNSEDLLIDEHYVDVPDDWIELPIVKHPSHSEYAQEGLRRALDLLPDQLAPLGLERLSEPRPRGTESHIQGTVRMGSSDQDSIVDKNMVHHTYRNLVVVGSSAFPTCPTANPSLTVAALSLRSASSLAG